MAVSADSAEQLRQRTATARQLAAWAWSLPPAPTSAEQPDARQRDETLEQFRAAG